MMTKRRELLRKIRREARRQGLSFERVAHKGGNHEIWKLDGMTIPVPRHHEIGDITAMGIYKEAAEKLGKGWWQ